MKSNKIKSAFFGGTLQFSRIIMTFLCALCFMIPVMSMKFILPSAEFNFKVSASGIFELISDKMISKIPDFLHSTLFGKYMPGFIAVAAIYMFAAFVALAVIISLVLCFLNNYGFSEFMKIGSFAGAALSFAAMVFAVVFKITSDKTELVSIVPVYYSLVISVAFIINASINSRIAKKSIQSDLNDELTKSKEDRV